MSAHAAITILIGLLVLVAICWVAFWLIDSMGLPSPINWIAKAIVALIGLLVLLRYTGLV